MIESDQNSWEKKYEMSGTYEMSFIETDEMNWKQKWQPLAKNQRIFTLLAEIP